MTGICQAIWDSDVDGIIVGNTTNKRPTAMPHLKNLTPTEEQHLLEVGGFSGPHLFEKTVSMVKKYKKLLGDSPPPKTTPSAPSRSLGAVKEVAEDIRGNLAGSPANNRVENSVQTGAIPTTNISEKKDSEKQPLINLPSSRFYDNSRLEQDELRSSPDGPESEQPPTAEQEKLQGSQKDKATKSISNSDEPKKSPDLARRDQPKVIFATGGITNGKQALEVLNAGATVAMVYTALVYGGVGTISRIKDEMRKELASGKETSKAKTVSR